MGVIPEGDRKMMKQAVGFFSFFGFFGGVCPVSS